MGIAETHNSSRCGSHNYTLGRPVWQLYMHVHLHMHMHCR